jgi:hypothetical protein
VVAPDNLRELTIPGNPSGDDDGDGYTNRPAEIRPAKIRRAEFSLVYYRTINETAKVRLELAHK